MATPAINDQLDNMTAALLAIAEKNDDGSGSFYFRNFKTLRMATRMGILAKILDDYDQIGVNRETGMSVAVHGTGITGATVDEIVFTGAIGTAETMEYEFIYDGSAWLFGGAATVLAAYGITVTGTPVRDDTIVVHESATRLLYDVLGIDHDIPSDPNYTHCLTLGNHYVRHYNSLAYKKPQALIYVDPAVFPSGLAAGQTYYITLNKGAYSAAVTDQDGSYCFTPAVAVPAGGAVRHTTMGISQTTYTAAQITSGTFTTYDTIANGRATLETGIACVAGATGTFLGTVTAEDITVRSADYLNLTRRNAYGSNSWLDSDERMQMNSDAAAGVKADGDMNWHEFKTVFDLPATYNAAGNLHGLDPALLAVIGPVRKRTYLHPADRSDQNVAYADSDELFFALSMEEVNKGTTNGGVHENAVSLDGQTVKTVPYPYFARKTANSEFVKYQGTTARVWWLRSPLPSYSNHVRIVNSSGALYYYIAHYTYGSVDACCIY